MTAAKTAAFTADRRQLARVAQALAHPARVAIFWPIRRPKKPASRVTSPPR